jgi:hypothetical protein
MNDMKKTLFHCILASMLLALTFVVTACKTKAAKDSGYLGASSGQMAEQRGRFPFQRVWIKPGVNKNAYAAVMISPVNTTYLMEATGWKAANPGNLRLEQEVKEMAQYTRQEFTKAFNEEKKNRFRVLEQPVPGTLVLDLAIVELIPSKAVLNAVAIVAPPEVAIPVSIAAGKASVAIEGRVRDAITGETLMIFADREETAHRIIDLKSVTWWGQARDSIDLWAKQMVKLANTPPDEKVKDEAFFKLRPW